MPRPFSEEVILVTGYPSFGARQLVEQIAREQPGAFVYAVVEADQTEQAQDHLASLGPEARQRVELLEGSVSHIDLGLSGAEFRRLCAEVDRIHHAAQRADSGVDQASAERVNIRGTLEALELARHCRNLRAFIHHSSAFVAGDREGTVLEEEPEQERHFRNHAESSLATAEGFVRDARKRLPVVILRPGLVIGDSHSGEVDRLDGLYLVVLLMLGAPADMAVPLPQSDTPLHIVPVDFVARAAHALGRDSRALGKTLHLTDPSPLSARQVFDLIAQASGRRTGAALPAQLTQALLHTPGLQRIMRSPRAFFDQLLTRVTFDTAQASSLLGGLRVPPFEGYVEQMVAYVRARVLVVPHDSGRPTVELDVDDLP